MNRLKLLSLVVLLAGVHGVRGQEIKNPAEVMPARTLFYAELREPGEEAQELAKLVAGSVLSNVPDSLLPLEKKYPAAFQSRRVREGMGMAGLMFASEIAQEMKRIQGAALAITGIDPKEGPEFVALVLPGKSLVPSFMMRVLLSVERHQVTDIVEGVPLRRWYHQDKDKIREHGPAFAMMPGALLIGTPENVKDVVLRIKGKGQGPSLASLKNFQDAQIAGPGLNGYVHPGGMLQALEKSIRPERDPIKWQLVRDLQKWLNPKAFPAGAFALGLENGSLFIRKTALIDAREQSGLLDLLPAQAVDPNILHFAPRDSVFALALSNTQGEERFKKLLTWIENFAPAPDREKVAVIVKELEKKIGLALGKDFFGGIRSLGVALGDPMKAPLHRLEVKGPGYSSTSVNPEIPLVILLQATDDQAAQNIVKAFSKLYAMLAGPPLGITTEKVTGQEITHIKIPASLHGPYLPSVYLGRSGATIVLGFFPNPVAAALNQGSKKQGLVTDPKVAAQLKDLNQPIALGIFKPSSLVLSGLVTRSSSSTSVSPKGEKDKEGPKEIKRTETIVKRPIDAEEERLFKALEKLLATEEPMILALTRKADRLQLDGQAPNLDKLLPGLIDFGIEEFLRLEAEEMGRRKR